MGGSSPHQLNSGGLVLTSFLCLHLLGVSYVNNKGTKNNSDNSYHSQSHLLCQACTLCVEAACVLSHV